MHTYIEDNRYRMKAGYQRNLLVAELVVVLLIGGPFFLWGLLSRSQSIPNDVVYSNIHVDPLSVSPADTKPTRRNVSGRAHDLANFHGEIGIKVKIIPDYPSPIIIPKQQPHVYLATELAPAVDSNISVADLTDAYFGPYVPMSADYMFTDLEEPESPTDGIVPCSVLVAKQPEYPVVAREQNKEGVAGLIVCIDESGKATLFPDEIMQAFREKQYSVERMTVKIEGKKCSFNYVVTYEQPSGYFFAKKVAEAVPKWTFAPSLVNGQPTKSLLPIGHAFCLTGGCDYAYAVLKNYRRFSAAP